MIFTILIFFFVLSILVIIHELGHFFAAKACGVKVEEFGFGIPPRIWGIKRGETLYSLNALPFGGFVKVFGEEAAHVKGLTSAHEKSRSFSHKPHWQKAVILTAGVFLNFVLGWLIVSYLFTQGIPVPTDKIIVQHVVPGSPAADAGILEQDRLISIATLDEKKTLTKTDELSPFATKHAGQTVTLVVQRAGKELALSAVPRANPPEGQGALGLAIAQYELKKYSYLEAPVYGLIESAKITGVIGQELLKTFAGLLMLHKPESEIAGPIGIAQLSSEAAKQGFHALLQLIGLLSLNLAVLNILPFPSLDGGRLAFVLYEWVSGRKVHAGLEQKLNVVGFAILISLILLVTANDILKLLR